MIEILLNPRVCNANVEGIVLKLQWKGFHDKSRLP